ncbi:mitochondrial nucleoid-associated protein 1 [Pseudorasbora parva]|uniref:mitochondrial nucleoid-associated protein 1 n=1 Tax=Pseudorasbora parva TaxID=51549 RepID=UPI00351E77A3
MSVEECPYCGKPFKRLKTHLPHCKMAPVAQTKNSIQAPKELSSTTSRQKIHKKTNDVIFDKRLTSKSKKKDDISNADILFTSSDVKVSSESVDMERPKSKWLAKRQRELERLQLLVPVLNNPSNPTSLFKQDGDKSFCEISKRPNQGTSQNNGKGTKGKTKPKKAPLSEQLAITKSKINTPGFVPAILKNSSLPSECNVQHENPKLKTKVYFLEELERLPNSQNKNIDLVSRAKDHKAHAFFISKTSVWDHINYSLYYKRSDNLYVPYPIIETFKDSALEISAMQQSNNRETVVTKVAFPPSLASPETIYQPAEDILHSRLQGVRQLSSSPERVTAYNRIQFSSVPLGSYAKENIWKKDQFPGPASQSEVQQKLGDVRLKELGVWLAARTPVSPREIVTMLKQGWQWYYRKYIDVRRGGIGGISMLLTGYCVLCYIWSYPHLKKERWRKYH